MTLFQAVGAMTAAVALFGYINHRLLKLPEAIGMTAVGAIVWLLLIIAGQFDPGFISWAKTFVAQIDFPEVVFHGMLGTLLFAGSLHVNLSDLRRESVPVVILATVGVLISTAVVGAGVYALTQLFGFQLSLAHCFLFGALISPTDPIAVLGVLKKAKVDKRLEMQVAGESLFNDGTAVVVFLLIAGIAAGSTEPTPGKVAQMIAQEVGGAIVLGALMGLLAYHILKGINSYATEIMLTIALATGGYALAEAVHVSAPLTVVVVGLIIGNMGKHVMSEQTREHLFSFWDLTDEVLNLILFGLIGLVLIDVTVTGTQWLFCLFTIPVVLLARFASVLLPMAVIQYFKSPPKHAVKVLTWGGLRGGISIALALSLPPFAGRELVVAATCTVVVFSLLVQGLSLPKLLKRLEAQE